MKFYRAHLGQQALRESIVRFRFPAKITLELNITVKSFLY